MLRQFGMNTICIDSTHGTNQYDLKLITLLVIDDFSEGIPVAWAISNREDKLAIIEILRAIKEKTGPIAPKWMMSDDAEQFFSAWTTVFGKNNTQKLLCTWHVDRAWRQAIRNHIQGTQEQVEVYHHLQLLQTLRDISEFRVLLQKFSTLLQTKSHSF